MTYAKPFFRDEANFSKQRYKPLPALLSGNGEREPGKRRRGGRGEDEDDEKEEEGGREEEEEEEEGEEEKDKEG